MKKKPRIGDIVRNPFGAVYDIIDYDKHSNQFHLKHVNGGERWCDLEEVEDWSIFRKI